MPVNIFLFGSPGRGKTKFALNKIADMPNRRNYIFDLKREWVKYGVKNYAENFLTREDFMQGVPNIGESNVNVVWEDATGFFGKGKLPGALVKHINGTFHSKNMNLFMYHGLSSFSTENLIYADFFVIYRTKDKPSVVRKLWSDPEHDYILEAYESVLESTEGTTMDRLNKTYPDKYSEQHFHDKIVLKIN